jgi:hypothetical protein
MRKTFRQAIVALCLMAAPMAASAQSLVFHLAGGEKTTVQLPATFTVTPDGDKLVVDAGSGNVVELAKDEVMCVTYRDAKGDVNGDQRVDVADVSTVVSLILGAGGSSPYGNAPKNAEAVDLGLPSGTKWANMNVGAEKPEDYGLFFAWGETTGYTSDTSDGRSFDWVNYKWCNGSQTTMTKYCANASYGTVDNQLTLLPADDAARANWGGEWSMPTIADIEELIDNTTSEWTTENSVNGRKFTAANGNSIFLPAAGCRANASLDDQSTCGRYWSALVAQLNSNSAWYLGFDSRGTDTNYLKGRLYGFSVRPVLRK